MKPDSQFKKDTLQGVFTRSASSYEHIAECFAKMQSQRASDGFHFQLSAFCTTAKKP